MVRIFKKIALFGILLTQSCGIQYLFQSTPQPIIDGFRQAYKVTEINRENTQVIIADYTNQLKQVAAYYLTRYYQLRLEKEIDLETKSRLEKERDELLAKFISKADENLRENLKIVEQNNKILQQLLEALYNYHSAEPLSMEKINLIIENSKELVKKLNG